MTASQRERGNTLIGMLVVVAIIAVMAVAFLGSRGDSLGVGQSQRADGKGRTVLGAAKASAQDDVCRSNLSQVRQSIMIQTTTDDERPASLDALPPAMKSVSSCPIGHEPYTYDPATGTVRCPHPGHGKY